MDLNVNICVSLMVSGTPVVENHCSRFLWPSAPYHIEMGGALVGDGRNGEAYA